MLQRKCVGLIVMAAAVAQPAIMLESVCVCYCVVVCVGVCCAHLSLDGGSFKRLASWQAGKLGLVACPLLRCGALCNTRCWSVCRQAHRLDVGTGGLMMVAKTRAAATRLTRDLAEHNIQKRLVEELWPLQAAGRFRTVAIITFSTGANRPSTTA
jgi:hypothetical protein